MELFSKGSSVLGLGHFEAYSCSLHFRYFRLQPLPPLPLWTSYICAPQNTYEEFKEDILSASNPPARLVILEIGCGMRIPTLRRRTEELAQLMRQRLTNSSSKGASINDVINT